MQRPAPRLAARRRRTAPLALARWFAEVRVDLDLCTIRVARVIGAYDAGRIINPRLAHSQCIGGMVGGIGMALLEEAEWDANLGRVANATLAEYLVPVCADVQELDAVFVESEDRIMNPLGVKGVAELGLCGGGARRRQRRLARDRQADARAADHPRPSADGLIEGDVDALGHESLFC